VSSGESSREMCLTLWKIAKNLTFFQKIVIFVKKNCEWQFKKKNHIFWQFKKKKVLLQFFDTQMAIFRMVRICAELLSKYAPDCNTLHP